MMNYLNRPHALRLKKAYRFGAISYWEMMSRVLFRFWKWN